MRFFMGLPQDLRWYSMHRHSLCNSRQRSITWTSRQPSLCYRRIHAKGFGEVCLALSGFPSPGPETVVRERLSPNGQAPAILPYRAWLPVGAVSNRAYRWVTVVRGPVPRHRSRPQTLAGDRPPHYEKKTPPFTVGRGPSHATRACERVPLARQHSRGTGPRATVHPPL